MIFGGVKYLRMSDLCIVCDEQYDESYGGYNNKRCAHCARINSDIQCHDSFPDKFYKDWVIDLDYDVITTEHDGYCSDPYEEEIVKSVEIRTYPLMKKFERLEGAASEHVVNHYIEFELGCKLGSNYCGLGSVLTLNSAHIRRK